MRIKNIFLFLSLILFCNVVHCQENKFDTVPKSYVAKVDSSDMTFLLEPYRLIIDDLFKANAEKMVLLEVGKIVGAQKSFLKAAIISKDAQHLEFKVYINGAIETIDEYPLHPYHTLNIKNSWDQIETGTYEIYPTSQGQINVVKVYLTINRKGEKLQVYSGGLNLNDISQMSGSLISRGLTVLKFFFN